METKKIETLMRAIIEAGCYSEDIVDEKGLKRDGRIKQLISSTLLPAEAQEGLIARLIDDDSYYGYLFICSNTVTAGIFVNDEALMVVVSKLLLEHISAPLQDYLDANGTNESIEDSIKLGIGNFFITEHADGIPELEREDKWFIVPPDNKNVFNSHSEAEYRANRMAQNNRGKTFRVAKLATVHRADRWYDDDDKEDSIGYGTMLETVSNKRDIEYSLLEATNKFHTRGNIDVYEFRMKPVARDLLWTDTDWLVRIGIRSTPEYTDDRSIDVVWEGTLFIHTSSNGKMTLGRYYKDPSLEDKAESRMWWDPSYKKEFNNIVPDHELRVCSRDIRVAEYEEVEVVNLNSLQEHSPEAYSLIRILETLIARNSLARSWERPTHTSNEVWLDNDSFEELSALEVDLKEFKEYLWEELYEAGFEILADIADDLNRTVVRNSSGYDIGNLGSLTGIYSPVYVYNYTLGEENLTGTNEVVTVQINSPLHPSIDYGVIRGGLKEGDILVLEREWNDSKIIKVYFKRP